MKLPYTNKPANILPQTPSETGGSCVGARRRAQCRNLVCFAHNKERKKPVTLQTVCTLSKTGAVGKHKRQLCQEFDSEDII